MKVGNAQYVAPLADASRGETIDSLPFLALGGTPPSVSNTNFIFSFGAPCAGIVLIDKVDLADLAAMLDAAPDPAVPIADFGRNQNIRSDFTGEAIDSASMNELRHKLAPILHRLRDLPFHSAREDRAEMTILRLAYSRDTAIEAKLDPESRNLVEYPLLGYAPATRQQLEVLADLDLLRRRHFTRTHLCGQCASARLHAYEACPSCNCADLVEEPIVHHYRCGWQEPQSRFVKDHTLICPKCRRELRHYGVDYDKPGIVLVCRGCGKDHTDPIVQFACLDCTAATPAINAKTVDWYHYDLTDDGMRSLRAGQIPRLGIEDHLDGYFRAFSPREFKLLVNEGVHVARRYSRPFTVGQLSLANVDRLREEHGIIAVDNAFRLMVDVLIESLRESDFIGSEGGESILIGFPETSRKDAVLLLDRISEKIKKVMPIPIELTLDAVEDGAAAHLLPREITQ